MPSVVIVNNDDFPKDKLLVGTHHTNVMYMFNVSLMTNMVLSWVNMLKDAKTLLSTLNEIVTGMLTHDCYVTY